MASDDLAERTPRDSTTCPRCGGSGEIERPVCSLNGCGRKMMRNLDRGGPDWYCPVHAGGLLL